MTGIKRSFLSFMIGHLMLFDCWADFGSVTVKMPPLKVALTALSSPLRNMSSKRRFISRRGLSTGLSNADRDAGLRSRSPRDQGRRSLTFMIIASSIKITALDGAHLVHRKEFPRAKWHIGVSDRGCFWEPCCGAKSSVSITSFRRKTLSKNSWKPY